jgi:hypothetical protein
MRWGAGLALALVLVAAPAQAATARVSICADSLGVHGRDSYEAIRPGTFIDAVGGRHVVRLPDCVQAALDRPGYDTVMVEALGTNPSSGWTKADYQHSVDMLAKHTKIVLVTPYRVPCKPNARCADAPTLRNYAMWMREIAKQSRVCLADWAKYVPAHPDWLVADGTHQTETDQGDGVGAWARLIDKAAVRCGA